MDDMYSMCRFEKVSDGISDSDRCSSCCYASSDSNGDICSMMIFDNGSMNMDRGLRSLSYDD
jgi:hypothetical protein